MIKLERLIIHNYGIFKDVDLEFGDKEVVGILAEYKNDSKRSNMSGKSLLTEAIRYNLVGITRYKKEAKMIHYGEEMMKVTCHYTDEENGNKYKIVRGRDSSNNGLLELDWIEKTKESQSAINNIFGVSKDDFDITSFFKQADINGFMDKSPAEKTAYLQKAMNNDHWKEKEEAVKEDIKALTIKLKENEAVQKALEEALEPDEPLRAEIKELEKSNKVTAKKIITSNTKLATVTKKIEDITKSNWKVTERIKVLTKELESAQAVFDRKNKLKRKIKEDKTKLDRLEEVVEFDSTQSEVFAQRIKVKSDYESKIEIINSPDASGLCPILEESCDRISLSDKNRKKLDKEIIKLKKELNEIYELESEMASNDGVLVLIKDLKVSIKNNITRYKDITTSDPNDLEDEIRNLNKSTKKIDSTLLEEVDEAEDLIEEFESTVNSNNNKITVLKHRVEQAVKALGQINDIYDKNEKLVNKLKRLKYIAMMFGKSGILADEIENAFTEIQDNINYNLKELDCGLTVSFSPDKELNKKEPVCSCGFVYYKNYKKPVCEECGTERRNARKDEISLQILDSNGNEADFEGGSGGQKAIISFAVRIALTMFKKSQNQCQLNMLFLDEVDSALDPHLAGAITDSITKVLTKKLGYSQILMISHKDEIKNSVPNIIKVTKFSDYSTAKFV